MSALRWQPLDEETRSRFPLGPPLGPGTLTLRKGISLLGAGRDNLTITCSGGAAIAINPDTTAISNEETIRVDGFTFDGNNAALKLITLPWLGPGNQQQTL